MSVLIFILIGYVILSAALYFIFPKADEDGWKGLVPGLNFGVWCRLIGRNPLHALWLLFPIVNIFIIAGMCIDMVRSFGKYSFGYSALAVVFAPITLLYLGLSKEEEYEGPTLVREREYREAIHKAQEKNDRRALKKLTANNPYKKSGGREWAEAIIFAVFAAAFIRMFLIEAYVIPTSSMEGSLLVGDFLFVSKAHYGIRTPQTIAMVPLLHNRIPGLGTESYLRKPQLPYYRLPALEKIDRNDAVVFNYPEGDSVYFFKERTWTIYDYRRGVVAAASPLRHQQIKSGQAKLIVRPMDKKDHYIKRCIAIPGDSLEIRDRQVYINGEPGKNPTNIQFMYMVDVPSGMINTRNFEDWGISQEDQLEVRNDYMLLILNEEQKEKIQAMDPEITITPFEYGNMERNPVKIFPHDPQHFPNWNVDNFGPIYIPKAGATVKVSPENIALYRRIIDVYEDNDLRIEGDKIFINGQEAEEYTFKMNYYWMMGDNRHNSEDARIWGYVPEDHIVGKPLFIWMSTKDWRRIFSSANKQ